MRKVSVSDSSESVQENKHSRHVGAGGVIRADAGASAGVCDIRDLSHAAYVLCERLHVSH